MSSPLDNAHLYSKIDTSDLGSRLASFPVQCDDAWEQALVFSLPSNYIDVSRVVVLGMGGSAIGGDLLSDLASLEKGSAPIHVVRSYTIPPYVDDKTLVIVCSYSGNTEETLSAFRQASNMRTRVVALTAGGALSQEAASLGFPVFNMEYQGEPRSALGYNFLVPLVVLQRLGLIKDKSCQRNHIIETLKNLVNHLQPESEVKNNPAKQIAQQLLGKLIVVYGSGMFRSVARRWKTQFNENSKVWAFFEEISEIHHNAVVGYELPAEIKALAKVVLLKPDGLEKRMALRYDITRELLDNELIPYRLIEAQPDVPLSQILTTILLGDYVSYYLAILENVDPSPVHLMDFVKSRLEP